MCIIFYAAKLTAPLGRILKLTALIHTVMSTLCVEMLDMGCPDLFYP